MSVAKRNSTTLLIDADVYAYQAASAVEQSLTFDGDNYTRVGSAQEALKIFNERIQQFLKYFNTIHFALAFSDASSQCFRKQILPSYKENRSATQRPVALGGLKDLIREQYDNIWERPQLEADDILGILSTSKRIFPNTRRVIVSVDKDMKSIHGYFWDSKDGGEMHRLTPEQAAYHHCYQTLTGDTADGYKGCVGYGPVKTEKLLGEFKDTGGYEKLWPLVLGAFEGAGLSEEDALVQARVARILQVQDYDYKKKEVKLWEPPK